MWGAKERTQGHRRKCHDYYTTIYYEEKEEDDDEEEQDNTRNRC